MRLFIAATIVVVWLQPAFAADPVPIRQSKSMDEELGMGTKGYSPLDDETELLEKVTEKPIDLWAQVKVPKPANVSEEEWQKLQKEAAESRKNLIPVHEYELRKQAGEYVGWFGIVRAIDYDKAMDQTRLRLEHKYFDGLTDLHLHIVSIYGAGDFEVVLPGKIPSDQIRELSLLRVYGPVSLGKNDMPVITAKYVRVWDWGLFTFMDYGKDKSNPKWIKLRKVQGSDVYESSVDNKFYVDRLGPRKAEAK